MSTMKNLNYPAFAAESGISGKVYIEFTVNSRGYVQDIKVVRGVHPSLDQEVLRVVASSPEWKPGIRGIHNVNVRFTIPISFVLQ